MFKVIRRRIGDMRTIATLCKTAEHHANAAGHKEPGAEHFVLAAFELSDGSAARVLERLQLKPIDYAGAIAQQYTDALRHIGVVPPDGKSDLLESHATTAASPSKGLYRAQPSGQEMMQALHAQQAMTPYTGLVGAHVILAAIANTHGVAARAFRALGIDMTHMAQLAQQELVASAAS